MEKTVVIMWFFIITGAIIVTKICLWEIDQKDITSILVGTMILLATWFTLG